MTARRERPGTLCTVIPPYVLQAIERNGTPQQRVAARASLLAQQRIRGRREGMAPIPGEPNEGEKRQIRDAKGRPTYGTVIRAEDAKPTGQTAADNAYDGLGNVFRYLFEVHKRNSLDGQGLLLIGVVNYDMVDNAAWDGKVMLFGSHQVFNDMTADGTVMAHELGHGVTQNEANLDYAKQPGAANEGFSDVIAALSEQYAYRQSVMQATWLIGQLICEGKIRRDGGKPAALRDMRFPGTAYNDPVIGKDPQPADMAHYVDTPEDDGGVHINSGIFNRAFAEAAMQRGGNAWETMGLIWYDVLCNRAASTSAFQDLAGMTLASATALFGAGSLEAQAVTHGWGVVGIDTGAAPAPAPAPSGSPCAADWLALLQDKGLRQHLLAVLKHRSVRRLIAAARTADRTTATPKEATS